MCIRDRGSGGDGGQGGWRNPDVETRLGCIVYNRLGRVWAVCVRRGQDEIWTEASGVEWRGGGGFTSTGLRFHPHGLGFARTA